MSDNTTIIIIWYILLLNIATFYSVQRDKENLPQNPPIAKCKEVKGSLIRDYTGEFICIKDLLKGK